jgi:hypothetical protein
MVALANIGSTVLQWSNFAIFKFMTLWKFNKFNNFLFIVYFQWRSMPYFESLQHIIHTWPPLDLCVDPALIDVPSVELSSSSKQWAADKRVNLSKMVAPQWCELNFCTDTCHGIGEGAGWPPTISLGSNRLVPVMKGGIVAIKEMNLFKIQKCSSITQ